MPGPGEELRERSPPAGGHDIGQGSALFRLPLLSVSNHRLPWPDPGSPQVRAGFTGVSSSCDGAGFSW